jgi:hypothetical protein
MLASVLTEHSEMVSTVQTFSACPSNLRILPEFHGLGDVPIVITKICGLWIPQMDTKAFGRATGDSCQQPNMNNLMTHNPIALAKLRKPPSVSTPLELRPEMTT